MKKIKILRLIARLNIGGPAIQAVTLTSELNDDHYSTLLVTGVIEKDEGDMSYLAGKHGVVPEIIPEMGREIHWYDDLITLFKLMKIIHRFKPDLIHTHTAKAGTIGRIAGILSRIPVRFHTFHGHVFSGYFNPVKTGIFIFIERLLAKFSSKIIAISPGQMRDLSEMYHIAPPRKFAMIPLGFDLTPFCSLPARSENIKKTFGLDPHKPVVTIVGRLVPIKNHELFIECANLLVNYHHVSAQFAIVGDGECRGRIQQQVEHFHLTEQVYFLGWQSDMTQVYRASDIVVLTSHNEGTPVSLIEAMAAGRPVVSTDVGAVRDVVDHDVNGFLSPANDVNQLTGKILLLLKNKNLREKFGNEGRKKVLQLYSNERLVSDIKTLYRSFFN